MYSPYAPGIYNILKQAETQCRLQVIYPESFCDRFEQQRRMDLYGIPVDYDILEGKRYEIHI